MFLSKSNINYDIENGLLNKYQRTEIYDPIIWRLCMCMRNRVWNARVDEV